MQPSILGGTDMMYEPEMTATTDGETPVRALDPRYYTDPGVFELETERIFYRTWQYAGHVSALARAGDYFTFAIREQQLFTVRGDDGVIRSFYNVCMHRAHELVQGAGNKRAITCPYHAWTYALDGRLRRVPNEDKAVAFDREAICLTEVRTEIVCGFVFVNLDATAEPMATRFPSLERELREYVPDIERLRPVTSMPVAESCNWKVSVENYNECYHCRLNHPTFASGVIDPTRYDVVPEGYCLRHAGYAAPAARMSYDVDPHAGTHATQYAAWFLWPAFSFQVYPGCVLNTYLWRPSGVATTTVYRGWYAVDGEASARQDRETTVAEDLRLVESVQRGLASRGYRPGPLVIDPGLGVNSEHSLHALHRWLLDALAH